MGRKKTVIRNLDFECYFDAVTKHKNHQEDWLRKGYAPNGFYLKDFCILKLGESYHLFHIAGTPGVSCCLPGNEIWFGHGVTRDFREWQTLEPCFYIRPGQWDEGHVFAPYVLAREDGFRMFYTGCSLDNTQRIGVAFSKDLNHWERTTDSPIIRPEEYEWAFCPTKRGSACRDPHVCQWDDEYNLYYTAVTKAGQACVARASSRNLIDWEDCGPAYVSSGLAHCESSNVQEQNGRYLLFFGGHHEYWSYVVSDNPFHWDYQAPVPLKKGITAMEVIRKKGQKWLVAYFKFRNYRMFLGMVDWSKKRPAIREIKSGEELVDFGIV